MGSGSTPRSRSESGVMFSAMTEATATDRKRQMEEISIFHDVAKALTSSLNLDSILQTIMEKMAVFFRPDTWSLLMVDEQKDELYFAIAVGDAADALKSIRLKVGEGIAGWVAKHGESLLVRVEVEAQQSGPGFTLTLANGRRIESSWRFAEADLLRLIRTAEA